MSSSSDLPDISNPAKALVAWYQSNGRHLPWREAKDPYRIWISEIILQQTRVAQGLDYYLRFVERFPDVQALADAPLEEVLKYWEGLGYYSRARNLHHTAQVIVNDLDGTFPDHYQELLKLKGIGPYTARAIGSFAFGNQVGVIDGNVLRVVSRYCGDFRPIDQQKTRKAFQAIVDDWVAAVDAAEFNQGIMDLGATVCTPSSPTCMFCPLQAECLAFSSGSIQDLPQKSKKLKRGSRYYNFYLIEDEHENLLIRQRPPKGVWAGLFEIPNVEVDQESWEKAAEPADFQVLGEMKHVLTHFDMHIRIYRGAHFPGETNGSEQFISRDKISIFAFSRAVLKIFDQHLRNDN